MLIQETARRTGGGWRPAIVLLSAAFGCVRAGVDQSLFDPAYL